MSPRRGAGGSETLHPQQVPHTDVRTFARHPETPRSWARAALPGSRLDRKTVGVQGVPRESRGG